MFKKLRNKIVLINMVTTTAVLFIAFFSIYFTAVQNAQHRPIPQDFTRVPAEQSEQSEQYSTIDDNNSSTDDNATSKSTTRETPEFTALIRERIHDERTASLNSLLISLIITGIAVEVMVFLISLYLAEQSIRPIRDTYNAQKEFIANASHEIKTPLAVIQANLEAADIHDNHWIDNVQTKVEDLAALNQQLLTLARLGATSEKPAPTTVNLPVLLQKLIAPLAPQLQAKNITFQLNTDHIKKPEVTLVKDDFKQIANILLDNAIKYCAKNITVTLTDHQLQVTNDGTTISPAKLPHLFERFYQVDKTKNGVGLGLAIAHQIATQNHWQLTATSDHTTTTFTLTFNKAHS